MLAVVTDDRKTVDTDGNTLPNYYRTDSVEVREYYPFGMVMPNRKTPAAGNSAYRYGFNGKENDDEVYGDDNEQDYGMRIYDPRLGRFLSVDPIARQYPELTVYQFAGNTPIWAVDLDGLEPWKVNTLDGGKTDFNGPYPDQKSAQINYDNSIDPASVTCPLPI